jgi:RimJ/RimL family protein N-acetyltransferase
MTPRLDGSSTWLAPFGREHLNDPRYYAWLRDYEVVKTINRPDYVAGVPFSEVERYCEAVIVSKTDLFWAIHWRESGLFIGTLKAGSINRHADTADIGILVGDRAMWGKGAATDAICTCGTYLFHDLGLRKLTAGLMGVNEQMLRVFLKLGFVVEGTRRQQDRFEDGYCDHIYLGCFADEFGFGRV